MIIPVPIHHLKKAERGYNQSDYIAKGLSKSLNIPYSTKTLKRTKYTESQTMLHINEKGKIMLQMHSKSEMPKKINGKNILVVDDIITTGATTQECARALVNRGAKEFMLAQ